jgi:DNA ligase-1
MINILAELFQRADVGDIDDIAYFLAGRITAGYKDVQLGMGDELMKSSLAIALEVEESSIQDKLRDIGDLGDVAAQFHKERTKKFQDVFSIEELTVERVREGLMQIATTSGSGSQEIMKKTMASLLALADEKSKRYIIRLAMGQMRLGVGDMTILDGLAKAFLGSKEDRPPIEHAYNVSSDLGHVAEILAKSGIEGIRRMRMAINRPVRPQLAQRVDKLSEVREKINSEKISAEQKYDGERIQAHKDGNDVTLFSRRLNDITHQFPDICENVLEYLDADTAIIDGEAVAYNFEQNSYFPFQKLMHRRRKYNVKEYAEEVPVKYMVFDLLYHNGSSMMRKNYNERTSKLHDILPEEDYIAPTGRIITENLDEIDEYFQDCIDKGLEGIICKSTSKDSYYHAGAREWSWIKWKPSYATEIADTLDLVVVGAYAGKGKRGGTYGALLCACYNHEEDMFQTVCKLGTGFTDKQLEEIPEKLEDAEMEEKPARLQVTDDLEPDYWFRPKYVLEVRGSEFTESPIHTCNWDPEEERGLGLRFPRFVRWRPDKSADQATTTEEIEHLAK